MSLSLLRAALLAAAAMASPALAADRCADLEATAGPGAQAVYDPFSPSDTLLNLSITVRNRSDVACQARFYVAPLGGIMRLSSGSNDVDYRIDAPRGGGAGMPEERGPFVIRVGGGENQVLNVPLIVRALQVVPRGDYLSRVELRGIAEGNVPVAIGSGSTPLRLVVPPRVEMSISGSSAPPYSEHAMAPASIDFGNAVSGATQRAFVNVWSNGSVAVSLSSQNQGRMIHTTDASLPVIRYSATFDGSPVRLEAPVSIQRQPPMSLSGASYPLALTLGDVGGKYAGRYKDVITVSVDQN